MNEIAIVLNGEPRRIASGLTVAGMLRALEVAGDRVAVELNRAIVRQPDWDRVTVEAGAEIEIVQFVGGG